MENKWFWELPRDQQDEILSNLLEAMKWRGWDRIEGSVANHDIHAVRRIAEIADLLYRTNRTDIEEYTYRNVL